jgi:hypothetical protein
MNKYSVKIPYSYLQYGYLTGFVFAEDSEEAYDIACDTYNIQDQEFDDSDSDGTEYDYNEINIDLEEEDTDEITSNAHSSVKAIKDSIPSYFLSDVHFL